MKAPFRVNQDPNYPVPPEAHGWRIYAASASAAWASAMFGYDSAFIGGTLSLASFRESYGLNEETATALSANIVGTFQAGCFFGSLVAFTISEHYGRRINLIVCGLVFAIGAILQISTSGILGLMYAGRLFTGLGVGGSAMVVPIYIAECAPPTIRGRCIGVFEVALQLASLCGFWVNYGVNQNMASTTTQWKVPFAIQLVPSGLLVASMIWSIETPRWLVKKGRYDLALKNLAWVRNLDPEHPYVQKEFSEMKYQVETESQYGQGRSKIAGAWKEIFSKEIRVRVALSVGMKFMQNFAGVNALNYYSPSIFKSIGFTGTSTGLLATGVYGVVKTVFTLGFITFFVDTWGRRPALLTGTVVAFIGMFYLGAYSYRSSSFDQEPDRDAGAYIAIVMIYVYAAAYAFSWNAMPWIFAAEIFPTNIRGLAMLITVAAQWISQFIVIYSVPYMIDSIKFGVFFFFGSCIFVSGFIVYCFIPETKGFPLEKSHMIFEHTIWAFKARKLADSLLAAEREEEATKVDRSDSIDKGLSVQHV